MPKNKKCHLIGRIFLDIISEARFLLNISQQVLFDGEDSFIYAAFELSVLVASSNNMKTYQIKQLEVCLLLSVV